MSRGIFEAAVVFFTARNMLGINEETKAYAPKQKYNGIVKWTIYSYDNYLYLYKFIHYLNLEYKKRYNKTTNHNSFELVENAYKDLEKIKHLFDIRDFLYPYQAMPLIFQTCATQYYIAYRKFYFFHKRFSLPFVSWTNRNKPYWYCYKYFLDNCFLPSDYY